MNNKKLGNNFEAEFCEILFENGFWCHNMAQNAAGQPADVIAVKDGTPYLIDCKVCSGGKFSLDRIEENQRLAMKLWWECGNGHGWFALLVGNDVFMLTLPHIEQVAAGKAALNENDIRTHGRCLKDWLEEP